MENCTTEEERQEVWRQQTLRETWATELGAVLIKDLAVIVLSYMEDEPNWKRILIQHDNTNYPVIVSGSTPVRFLYTWVNRHVCCLSSLDLETRGFQIVDPNRLVGDYNLLPSDVLYTAFYKYE